MPPNGYDTFVQQTPIPLKEIIPLPPNQILLNLLMKIDSSHRRFGFRWLCYLCLCCLQNTFWPLVEILPLLWICRDLSLRWLEGVAVILGLGFGDCATSIYAVVILTFLPLVEILPFRESAVIFLLFAVQQPPWSWSVFPSFTLILGSLFALGKDSLLFSESVVCSLSAVWKKLSNGHWYQEARVCRP